MSESSQTDRHANESFRFVQLSDLHLSSIDVPNPLRLFNKRILGYLSWLRKRRHTHQRWVLEQAIETFEKLSIDHYAITGDLTHIGLKNEFQQVQQWLEQLDTAKNITLIPGNHDLYVNERWSRSFELWEQYLHGDNHSSANQIYTDDALTQLNNLYPIVRIRKNIAFIGLNSVFDAPWFRATGQLDPSQLQRLKEVLASPELDKYCKILLIHHPLSLTNTPARKCLLNHNELRTLLSENPVDLVLHGHGHHTCFESIETNSGYSLPVIGISSSSSISEKPGYQAEFLLFQISQLTKHWEIEMQSYKLDGNERIFKPDQQKVFTSPQTHLKTATV